MAFVLQLPAIWRWVLLVAAIVVVIKTLIGWLGKRPFTKLDGQLGMAFVTIVDIQVFLGLFGGHAWGPPNFVVEGPPMWDAILHGKPYPVKAAMFLAHNAMVGIANTKGVDEALRALEFFVVGDFFMTPTAELADIVLRCATWPERSEVGWFTTLLVHAQFWDKDAFAVFAWVKALQVGETKSELEIYCELAKRMKMTRILGQDRRGF